jgi:Zn-dependent peptidase ImmA (M78 family)/transcriptional regulator with XRE-family HTH domain
MLDRFYGDRLRLARLLKGYTLQEVGEAVHASRQYINQLEGGAKTPSLDVLNAIAEFLKVTSDFFSIQRSGDVKFEQCHFRKRRTTPVGVANRVLAYSTILEHLVEELNEQLDLPENSFNFVDTGAIEELSAPVIEKIAEVARERWGLTVDAPIDNMVEVAENVGAVVTYFDGVSDKVDALSVNRKYPLIIRNSAKASICRMRFDLAHECGHLLMHEGIETGCPQTEKEADMFASAFLFPRKAFAREFPKCIRGSAIDWNEVYRLKQRWKVSARAIIYRSHFLGFINAQQYRAANIWFSKTRQTKSERGDELIPEETPHILVYAMELLNTELGISFEMMAAKLGVTPETLSDVTGIPWKTAKVSEFNDVVVPFKF